MGRAYCLRCEEEIDGLAEMAAEKEKKEEPHHRELRQAEAVHNFRRAARWVRRWLWLPELVFVLGVILYLGTALSVALLRLFGAW